jgi:hypothetical protein
MSILVKYLRLPSRRKRLLHAALAWVILSRIGLALFSLPRLQRFSSIIRHQSPKGATLDELRWAVVAVARRVPGTRCLPRALALQALMARAGMPARLCIGVAKESDSALEAHAWVLHEGVPVFDEPDLERYTLLSAFPA